MDWQHLIMNGESLAEYAALLASKGLLGHQHANSGWGTFDDDNMVGATAAALRAGTGRLRRRRPRSGSTSTRTPRTRSRQCGRVICMEQYRRPSTTPRREAQSRKDAVRHRAGLRSARRLTSSATSAPRSRRSGSPTRAMARHEEEYPLSMTRPLGGAGSRGLVAGYGAGARCGRARGAGGLDRADARYRAPRRGPGVLRLWNDQRRERSAPRSRSASASSGSSP